MNVVEWLESIRKLDQLIDAKIAEKERVRELMVNTVGSIDGMPHAPGISDKVGNLTVKLISLEEELNEMIGRYVDEKEKIVKAIERLPEREYGVLHRYYLRSMTLEQIAEDMEYSVMHIWRIKKNAIKLLENSVTEKVV